MAGLAPGLAPRLGRAGLDLGMMAHNGAVMAQKMLFGLLPVLLTAAIFTAVLLARGPDGHATPFPRQTIPHEAFNPDRCTWDCHNHGCQHRPRLPDWLSGD